MRFDDPFSQLKALEDQLYPDRQIRRVFEQEEVLRRLGVRSDVQALIDQATGNTDIARAAEILGASQVARALSALEKDSAGIAGAAEIIGTSQVARALSTLEKDNAAVATANIGLDLHKSIDLYTTSFDLGSKHAEMMNAITGRGRLGYAIEGRAIEQALRISEPWILRDDPRASLEAFAKLSKLGSLFQETSPSHALLSQVRDIAGEYLSDRAFAAAAHDIEARQRLYERSGLHELVAPVAPHAFLDVLWETRVAPAPPPRSVDVETTPSGIIVIRADDYETRAYLEVRGFEPPLRRRVRAALDGHYGPGWEAMLPPDLVKRLAKAAAEPGASQDLLDHTTFYEITSVMSHPRFWAEVFEPMLGITFDEFIESMNRIRRVRNSVAHYKGLLREDFTLITVEVRVLSQALGFPPQDSDE